jgi:glycosyltransferase involved in cell wall biosynthesis
MNGRMRIALVAPVATSVPPPRSGSIETLTALLADGLVAGGHAVTLFATRSSVTRAALHATFDRGYREDAALWPWELCELFNLAAAVERSGAFDVIHAQSAYYPMSLAFTRMTATPIVQTVHHAPQPEEIALWERYAEAPLIAVSHDQRRLLSGLNVVATVPHAVDTAVLQFRPTPDDYLLFLGRFTEEKGVVPAIEIARRAGMRIVLAAEANAYFEEKVAPLVDGQRVVYAGEVGPEEKAALLGGARALVYPVQVAESFGLVLAEAMACGTPVAALDRGAVSEVVDDGVTGAVFPSVDALVAGLARVLALDRARVHATAVARFGVDRMVQSHVDAYARVIAGAKPNARAVEAPYQAAEESRGRALQ